MRVRLFWAALATSAFFLALHAADGAEGQETAPRLVYSSVEQGDAYEEPVFVFQLCFAEPIDTRDLQEGGTWAFSVREPDGRGLGHRAAFQGNGYGVTVYPGQPPGAPEGEWTFTWRVTSPDGSQATEGEIKYSVNSATGEPVSREVPNSCIGEAGTVTPTPVRETVPASGTPTETPEKASPTAEPGGRPDDDDDEPDVLLLALLTIGAAGGAALIALVGYFVRRAIGYEPHRPMGEGDGHGNHH
jgi:hypothetical protein